MHSSIMGFGRLEGGLDTITEVFLDVLSKGLLVIPSFTYSWCNGKPFDPSTSECPREVGNYSQHAWKDRRFIRSGDPNFCVAALKNEFNQKIINKIFDIGQSCFGEKSVFDHMYQLSRERDGYIMLLGGAHSDYLFRCAFIHYVEEKVGVPSRYLKTFCNPRNHDEYVKQMCRYMFMEEYVSETGKKETEYTFPIISDYTLLGKDLMKSNHLIRKPFGFSETRMVNMRIFCDFLEEKFSEFPDYCVQRN